MRNYNAAGNTRSRCACEPDAASDRQPEYVVAMAYVPWQHFKTTYELIRHPETGTMIFPELDKPFSVAVGRGCRRC